jgi:hypothetical protein
MDLFARVAVVVRLGLWGIVCSVACGTAFTTNRGTVPDAGSDAGSDAVVDSDAQVDSGAQKEACGPASTCPKLQWECGSGPDSCGNIVDCGKCARANAQCGTDHTCHCTAIACSSVGAECGTIPDGCGGTESCGTCPATEICSASSGSLKCGAQPCVPKTCAEEGAECGPVGDGCGTVLQCPDTCVAPESCGVGGANACGCVPETCATLGWECGPGSDGCGGTLHCGTCRTGTCDTSSNTCSCVPTSTCKSFGYTCGSFVDSCMSVETCGNQPKQSSMGKNPCNDNARPLFYQCACALLQGNMAGGSGLPILLDGGTPACAGPTPPEPSWDCVVLDSTTGSGADAWCCAPPP